MAGVAYNPDDPLQAGFLAALAQGETGGVANSASIGVGGTSLSGDNTDAYGFPNWQGFGNSHAAGTYQFQPATWDTIAQEYNLDFQNSSDQSAGAWYLAEQTDPNLYNDLQTGNYSAIQSALKSIWPSVTGNGAAPQGLAADIATDVNTNTSAQSAQTAANNASGASGSTSSSGGSGGIVSSLLGSVGGPFAQGALIVIGAVIIFVGLWMLLSSQGIVPSPKQVGKDALAIGA